MRIIRGLATSIVRREVSTPTNGWPGCWCSRRSRWASPGLLLEHWFRTTLSRPVPTACFLVVNGLVLLLAERLRRRDPAVNAEYVDERVTGPESDARLASSPPAAR